MSRRTVFGSLLCLVFLVNLARVVFAPLLEPLEADFVVTDATLGFVATLAWLGSALPRIPVGYLLTRVSRERVVLGSGVLLAGAATAMSFADTIETVMVGAFLMGLASGSYYIAANPLVSELFPRRVGTSIGIHGGASQVAAVAAPGIVLAALAIGGWRMVARGMAVAAAVVTVAFVATTRRTDLPDAGTDDRDLLEAVREQWRIVLTAIVFVGATGLVWNGFFNFYVKFLTSHGFTSDRANLLLTLVFGAGVPAFAITGRLADRLPIVPLLLSIVGGFVVSLLALTSVASTGAFLPVAVASVVTGYVVHSLFPTIDTYLLDSLPDRHRSSAYAAYSGGMMLFQATGSSVVGTMSDAGLSYDVVFTTLAIGLGVVFLAMLASYLTGRLPAAARA